LNSKLITREPRLKGEEAEAEQNRNRTQLQLAPEGRVTLKQEILDMEREGEPPVRQLGAGGEEAGGVTAFGAAHPEEDPLATIRITATPGKNPGKLNSRQEDASPTGAGAMQEGGVAPMAVGASTTGEATEENHSDEDCRRQQPGVLLVFFLKLTRT